MHHGVNLGRDLDERSDQKNAGVSEDKREAPVCAAQERGHQQEFERDPDQPATHLDRELRSHAPPFYDGTVVVDPRIDARPANYYTRKRALCRSRLRRDRPTERAAW